ncbi:hypothetical protein G3N96_05120 [Burkholderia sp. Se-20373]|uniref:hypothetical protein n=1 Tax=Burkholderia sp. Se-20373 TaxID=2703898 RepID=UPI001981C49B|nr:hypothetical protein [Burkholderia sp. Se-20373]MBN3744817.1 hypothetical protein [Burkholderia sp. Se-20373]
MMEPLCRLPASGLTDTPASVLVWADKVVLAAKRKLNGFEPRIRVWAYRHNGADYLAADISDEHESSAGHPITFVIGDDLEPSLNLEEPSVPDMADALHLVGIVAAGLKAGVTIGCRGNEVNEAVLARPLGEGETNGAMRVAGI